jgi:hypothetical protein
LGESFNIEALPSFLKIDATPVLGYNEIIGDLEVEKSLRLDSESNSQFDNLMSKQFD